MHCMAKYFHFMGKLEPNFMTLNKGGNYCIDKLSYF